MTSHLLLLKRNRKGRRHCRERLEPDYKRPCVLFQILNATGATEGVTAGKAKPPSEFTSGNLL
jgi:hypothetical protein